MIKCACTKGRYQDIIDGFLFYVSNYWCCDCFSALHYTYTMLDIHYNYDANDHKWCNQEIVIMILALSAVLSNIIQLLLAICPGVMLYMYNVIQYYTMHWIRHNTYYYYSIHRWYTNHLLQ
jgi:uncharacterized membrane protein